MIEKHDLPMIEKNMDLHQLGPGHPHASLGHHWRTAGGSTSGNLPFGDGKTGIGT